MPEVFDQYYSLFGYSAKSRLKLRQLTPAYKVFFENQPPIVISSDLKKDAQTFDAVEAGSGAKLRRYVAASSQIYQTAVSHLLYSNFESPAVFLKRDIMSKTPQLFGKLFQTLDQLVSGQFHDQRLQQILEYHSVFLGSSPFEAPAIYSLMSHLDFRSGVFYPVDGMMALPDDLMKLGKTLGVRYHLDMPVTSIIHDNGRAAGVKLAGGEVRQADVVISNADLHFTETQLVSNSAQTYTQRYWTRRQSGPSALLVCLGVSGSLPELEHHSLFFVEAWQENFKAIYSDKRLPDNPSFYVCNPSKTDKRLAPKGTENLFMLVPIAAGVKLSQKRMDKLADDMVDLLGERIGVKDLRSRAVCRYVFGPDQFSDRYNAWLGNAFGGESHLLKQSVFLRTKNYSKKLKDLYYVGAGTTPGVGLPMCLISAELAYKRIMKIRHNRPLAAEDLQELA